MIPDDYRDLLESTALAHVATIGPRGEPQGNPVWFGWDGEHLLFSQTKTRQKYRNVRRDPRVAVSIVDPANRYRYLEIRGVVERIDDDPDLTFINSMAKKYTGQDEYPNHQPGDERVVIASGDTDTPRAHDAHVIRVSGYRAPLSRWLVARDV